MKLGIIGLPQSGKKTVFEALTKRIAETSFNNESRIETITVPDKRIGALSAIFEPEKEIYAQIKYFLPKKQDKPGDKESGIYTQMRDCDAFIHVVRNFESYGAEKKSPYKDFQAIEQELILADLLVVEKRIERVNTDRKRGKPLDIHELSLLNEALKMLEAEKPLRKDERIASAPELKGFALITAKHKLVLFNNDDEDENLPIIDNSDFNEETMVLRGKLEHEIMQMPAEEAAQFLEEFNIAGLAMDRVIEKSYAMMGLISFFTVGKDEVRAWTIKKDTAALDAAEVIHSDIKKGFIRAEVVSYEAFMKAGSYPKAKEAGAVRLEGKTYKVLDGDIINFRFNV